MTTKPVTIEVSPDILLCAGYVPKHLLDEERALVARLQSEANAAKGGG